MRIWIDNGHGAGTKGKQSPDGRLREYAYARDIARRVVDALKKKGLDARYSFRKRKTFRFRNGAHAPTG